MLAHTNTKENMSIVIVGGNDRMAIRYQHICKSFNFGSEVFTQMPADFENKLGAPDIVGDIKGFISNSGMSAVRLLEGM